MNVADGSFVGMVDESMKVEEVPVEGEIGSASDDAKSSSRDQAEAKHNSMSSVHVSYGQELSSSSYDL